MPTRIGKTVRQYIEERQGRDPEFAEALAEARLEGDLAMEIARLRELRGMSQYDLAEAAGIKQPMINRIERGAQNPTLPTLRKLASALRATIQISARGVELHPDAPEAGTWVDLAQQQVAVDIAGGFAQIISIRQKDQSGSAAWFFVEQFAHAALPKAEAVASGPSIGVISHSRPQALDDNLIDISFAGLPSKRREEQPVFGQPVA